MFEFNDSSNSNADPVTGKGEATRVAKGPAGSQRDIRLLADHQGGDHVSDNGLMFTYKVSGDEVTMTSPTGQSYTRETERSAGAFQGRSGYHQRIGKDDGQEHARGD